MRRKQQNLEDYPTPHNEITQPIPRTSPLPTTGFVLREPWYQRFARSLGIFLRAVVRKINQLLRLAFVLLVLLLLTRMALIAFSLTGSIFSQWVFQITEPAVFPFNNLLPIFLYNGLRIDASILVAIVVYAIIINVISRVLRILVE
jgi:uncharacterized protein YggT (Ycf19 family)